MTVADGMLLFRSTVFTRSHRLTHGPVAPHSRQRSASAVAAAAVAARAECPPRHDELGSRSLSSLPVHVPAREREVSQRQMRQQLQLEKRARCSIATDTIAEQEATNARTAADAISSQAHPGRRRGSRRAKGIAANTEAASQQT